MEIEQNCYYETRTYDGKWQPVKMIKREGDVFLFNSLNDGKEVRLKKGEFRNISVNQEHIEKIGFEFNQHKRYFIKKNLIIYPYYYIIYLSNDNKINIVDFHEIYFESKLIISGLRQDHLQGYVLFADKKEHELYWEKYIEIRNDVYKGNYEIDEIRGKIRRKLMGDFYIVENINLLMDKLDRKNIDNILKVV